MPFQSAYKYQPGAGIPGSFASSNPRSVYVGDQGINGNSVGPIGMIAGYSAQQLIFNSERLNTFVTAGKFCWTNYNGEDSLSSNAVFNVPTYTNPYEPVINPPIGLIGATSATASLNGENFDAQAYNNNIDGSLIILGGNLVDVYTGGDFFVNLASGDFFGSPNFGDPIYSDIFGNPTFFHTTDTPDPEYYVKTAFIYEGGWNGNPFGNPCLCIISAPAV